MASETKRRRSTFKSRYLSKCLDFNVERLLLASDAKEAIQKKDDDGSRGAGSRSISAGEDKAVAALPDVGSGDAVESPALVFGRPLAEKINKHKH